MNRHSTFKEQLEGKKSANFIFAIITGVVSVGLILYCLITKTVRNAHYFSGVDVSTNFL